MTRITTVLIFTALLLFVINEDASAKGFKLGGKWLLWTPGEPLQIEADRLDIDSASSCAVFEGNVKIVQKDVELSCHKLSVETDKDGGLLSLKAEGALRIKRADFSARAMRGEYDHAKRILKLFGKPELEYSGNEVSGEVISVFFEEEKVSVEKARARIGKNTESINK